MVVLPIVLLLSALVAPTYDPAPVEVPDRLVQERALEVEYREQHARLGCSPPQVLVRTPETVAEEHRGFERCLNRSLNPESGGFRMSPSMENGLVIGMKIKLNNPEHPLARLGAEDGDILLSFNDIVLTGPSALTDIYRSCRESEVWHLFLERDGERRCVNLVGSP